MDTQCSPQPTMSDAAGRQRRTQAAPCTPECVCGGRLSQQDCDVRSDILWAAILGVPGSQKPAA
jgi:hypothetical protein